jgi:hypothetical protein
MLKADALKVIVGVMAPYVGETMARSAAEAQCRRLGITDAVAEEQEATLLARLGGGLNIFIGREKSSSLVSEMRAALRAARQP